MALTPTHVEASAGSQLQRLDDGVILADGAAKENEIYRVSCEAAIPAITAVQLQALPHESLPGGGPGCGLAGGFRLAELQLTVSSTDAADQPRSIKFREVLSSDGESGLARLIDGDTATVWTYRKRGQAANLTFLPAQPIRTSGTAVLSFTLHNRENLGCFQLRATSLPNPRPLVQAGGTGGTPSAPVRNDLFTLFVNLGGGPWQDPAGNAWVASKEFDGATFGHEAGQAVQTDAIQHPVYSTAVRKLTAFRAVVPNGDYSVELHFNEHWTRNAADRAFAVAIEQQPVLKPPLFFQGPGMGQPYVHSVGKVVVKDGCLDVDFSPTLPGSLSILNGIVIRRTR